MDWYRQRASRELFLDCRQLGNKRKTPKSSGQVLVNAVTGQVARPFGKAVKAQKRGNHEANCSDNRPIVPNKWSLERDRLFAFEYLPVGSRHQDVEVERQTEQSGY